MVLLPKRQTLEDKLEGGQKTFKCGECGKEFQSSEMQSEVLPDNFNIAGLGPNQKIPKCPHCGDLAFFGFEVIDIAF